MPRSAIHFYLKAGVLPPAEKTARNAALYSERHLGRLRAIARLKSRGGELPVPLLRRAAELMDLGVEPDVAIALERAVGAGIPTGDKQSGTLSTTELARRSGIAPARIKRWIEARVLIPLPGGGSPRFDATDLVLVRTLAALFDATGLDPELGTRISDTIRDLSRYEMSLRNRVAGPMGEAGSAEVTLRFQEAANMLHTYFFYRHRLHDIAELRASEQADTP